MTEQKEGEMFSDEDYDNDALSLHSASADEHGSGSEDDLVKRHYRSSRELRDRDHSLLKEEDEQIELLRKKGPLDTIKQLFKGSRQGNGLDEKSSRREARRQRRKERAVGPRKRPKNNVMKGEGELMFEMEEGYKDASSQSETSSIELDRRKWDAFEKQPRKPRFRRLAIIHVLLIGLFIVFAFGAYIASTAYRSLSSTKPNASHLALKSNGTHTFRPTTILISLDGFRADFLTRDLTPTLDAFIKEGISPPYMLPSFPSVTFPNHFTLVTGLYPEAHGLVGNTFWDPELEEEFSCNSPFKGCTTPKWWTAEPIWVTAEEQNIPAAIHMWPGSEAHIPPIEPTYVDKFNGKELLPKKVDRILSLLDLPSEEDLNKASEALTPDQDLRPQLIAAYVPNVDTDGHNYGPNSTEISSTISRVDTMLSDLFARLGTRNLTSVVNVIVVSDHGMATTSTDRLIELDDLIDLSLVSHLDGWPLRGLRFHNPNKDLDATYRTLLTASQIPNSGFSVYLTNSTMPSRYHFSSNPRIAPLWVVPNTGWAIVERTDFDVAEAKANNHVYHPRGLHGYDNEHPLMRAIFVARGPAFPHRPGSRMPVFQNTEVYNIVCDSLGIEPKPNNGTLRLPLKPVGVHSGSEGEKGGGKVEDLPPDADLDVGKAKEKESQSGVPGDAPTPPNDSSGTDTTESGEMGKAGKLQSWWDLLHDKVEQAKEWAKAWLDHFKKTGELTGDPPMDGGEGESEGAAGGGR